MNKTRGSKDKSQRYSKNVVMTSFSSLRYKISQSLNKKLCEYIKISQKLNKQWGNLRARNLQELNGMFSILHLCKGRLDCLV